MAADQGAAHWPFRLGGGGSKGSRRKSGAVPATVKPIRSGGGEVRNLPWSVVRFPAGTSRGAWARLPQGGDPSVTTRIVNRRMPMPALPVDPGQIVITASRAPESEAADPGQRDRLDPSGIARLGEPLVPALLRLTPSAAVTDQGPAGLFTEVRIRGAETNHTLLFIDGIKLQRPGLGRLRAVRAAQRRPRVADRDHPRPAIGVVGVRGDRRRRRRQRGRRPRRVARQCRGGLVRRCAAPARRPRMARPLRTRRRGRLAAGRRESTASAAGGDKDGFATCRAGCAER